MNGYSDLGPGQLPSRGGGPPPRLLELCAGAGQIGLLALALRADPASRLIAVDADAVACDYIRRNAHRAGLIDRVEIRHGTISEVMDRHERFDLILADPPWVERARVAEYSDDPVLAIDGGGDGLDIARACLRLTKTHLRAGGSLVLQVGSPDQVAALVREARGPGSPLRAVEARHFDASGSLVRFVAGTAGTHPGRLQESTTTKEATCPT